MERILLGSVPSENADLPCRNSGAGTEFRAGDTMKTCGFLHNQINFEPKGIQPCCDVRAVSVPLFPFSGGGVQMDEYARHIADVSRHLQTGARYCAGCPELRDDGKPFTESPVRLRIAAVSVNHHRYLCNCRCSYCDLWRAGDKTPPYDVLSALKSLAEQGALAPDCVISWGGGEPSILREFPEACRWGMENKYYQYVHTSALRYSPAIAEMLANGSGLVNISLDSGNAAGYKKVKGVDGWDRVLHSLEQYAEASLVPEQLDLKYIIFEDTNDLPSIEDFFRLCLRFGITKTQYSLNFKEVNARAVSKKTLIAAAFFKTRADQLGLVAESFYIDPPMTAKISAYEAALFAEEAAL